MIIQQQYHGNIEVLTYWLNRFPRWDLGRREFTGGHNALHLAIGHGREKQKVFDLFLKKQLTLVDQKSWSGATNIIHACANADADRQMLQTLLFSLDKLRTIVWKNGQVMNFGGTGRVNARLAPQTIKWRLWQWYRKYFLGKPSKTIGTTALHFAASRGDYDIVKLLIRAGADSTIKSEEGKTALDFAETYGPYPLLRSYLSDATKHDMDRQRSASPNTIEGIPTESDIDDLLGHSFI